MPKTNAALWLFDNGIRVFPVRERGKEPACQSWDDYTATRKQVAQFVNYGVALGLLAVADSDTPETEAWTSAHLPTTPFVVTTGRGRHRYYRIVGNAPHFFHRDSFTVEFRHAGQYVIGAGSIHASGAIYTADDWSWNINDIPIFPVASFEWDDRPLAERGSTESGVPLILPTIIKAGERHDMMFLLMRSLQARGVTDLAVLLKVLQAENLVKCSPPIDRAELEKYITRVSRFKDQPGFERDDQDGITVAGGMLEAGLSADAAVVLVKSVDLSFDFGTAPDYVRRERSPYDDVEEIFAATQPSRPSQPILAERIEPITPDLPVPAAADMAIDHIAKSSLLCCRCGHGWQQKRADVPKKCPRCRSTLWNREQILLPDDDDGEEIVDLDEDDSDVEIGDEDEDDDSDVFEEVEEDGPIYDEETGEIVGHTVNGEIIWKDTK